MRGEGRVYTGLIVLCAALCGQGCVTAPTATAGAASAQLIPRDVLFRPPERSQVRLSPDGTYLTWLAKSEGVSQIWIARRDEVAHARPLTTRSDGSVSGYEWARNGKRILYSQDRKGTGPHIYSHDVESGLEVDLTPFEEGSARIAALSAARPDEIGVIANARDPESYDAWRINVITGARTMVFENRASLEELVFDQRLTPRIGLRPNDDGSVTVLRLNGGELGGELLTIPVDAVRTTSFLGFDSTNRYLYLLGHSGSDKSSLTRVHVDQSLETAIAQGGRSDIQAVLMDPVLGEPEAYSEHYFRDEWFPISDRIGGDLRFLVNRFEGDYRVIDRTVDNAHWLLFVSSAADPGAYYIYDRIAGSIQEIFAARPMLRAYDLADAHLVELTARDGLPLMGYLTLPPGSDRDGDGRPQEPVPMVLSVHGGPWSRSTFSFNPVTQLFVNRGYAVLDMNYRGSKGYGLKSFVASYREWGRGIIHDLVDAVTWAIEEGIAPADRIAIYGHSFGGFATLAGLAFSPDVFRCGVEYAGISNLFSQIETFSASGDSPASFYRQAIGDPETEDGRALLRAQSPLYAASRISKPLLIAHGAKDRTVAQTEADQVVDAMKTNGQVVTYLVFPDEGHNFSRLENQEAFRAVTEVFLAGCLGGRSEAFGGSFEGSSIVVATGAEHVPGLAESLRARQKGTEMLGASPAPASPPSSPP